MNDKLNERVELFIRNRDIVKLAIPWQNTYFYSVCSSLFTDNGVNAEVERLKECRGLLKSRFNAFSSFRGIIELIVVSKLAASSDPEEYLMGTKLAYDELKEHFFSSEYLPIAAMIISEMTERDELIEVCKRTRRVYELMKKEHPFLTSSEDCVFAALIALSGRDEEAVIKEAECCYGILSGEFFDKNAVQSLSHALALADDGMKTANDKCRDLIRLFDILKENKYKYGTGYELSTLGVLSMLGCGVDETARRIVYVAEKLKGQKGYGFFGIGKQHMLMHAGMIVSGACSDESGAMSIAALSSTVSLAIAQQAATCAAIAASVAATNAARST